MPGRFEKGSALARFMKIMTEASDLRIKLLWLADVCNVRVRGIRGLSVGVGAWVCSVVIMPGQAAAGSSAKV
jgi:hypothetical protein